MIEADTANSPEASRSAGDESRKVLEYAHLNSYFQSGLENLLDKANRTCAGCSGSAMR